MEHKIGEIVTLPDGRKAKVVERNEGCRGCIIESIGECWLEKSFGECYSSFRTDHKNIIYKEIKDNSKNKQFFQK